ncbi:MAG: CAP domain-containing protein [Ruminococcus flavefaciens]|nr:CAP domain-containing protein [Ruminococcus flavefaciens]
MKTKLNYTMRIISVFMAMITTSLCMCFPMKTSGSDEPDFKEMAEQMIVLVNEARVAEGLNPIYAVPYLCDMSYVRARECIVEFSHQRIDGTSFIDLVDENLIPWERAYENIAAGMSTVEGTFNQWKESPKHWSAIMNPNVTHMGVGVAYEPNSLYGWYWEQMFIEVWDDVESLPGQYYPDKYSIVPKSYGDLNGDGVIDSFDYVMINQYLAKEITFNPLQIESADMLKDGAITYSDAAYLKKYILGEINELPVSIF